MPVNRMAEWTRVNRLGGCMVAACLMLLPVAASGQALGLLDNDSDDPVEIEATQGIEWRQEEKKYIARGDVRATRGEISVFGDEMTAHYRDSGEGGSQIYLLEVTGNVRIESQSETARSETGFFDVDKSVLELRGNVTLGAPGEKAFAHGDVGKYDLNQGVLVLSGRDLRFESPETNLTATDSLEYWESKSVAIARGNATATRGERKLAAQVLTAYILNDDASQASQPIRAAGAQTGEIHRIQGFGGILISDPETIATASRGDYNVVSGVATLVGGVKITRGRNQLNGERAEVNLNTGISRLIGDGSQRVRGLLVRDTSNPIADSP